MLCALLWILWSLHIPSAFAAKTMITTQNLEAFANSIGSSLFNFGIEATKANLLKERFERGNSTVIPLSLQSLYDEISSDINRTFAERVKALEKTVMDAEQQALNHYNKINPELPQNSWIPRSYYNSKKLINEETATKAETLKMESWPFPYLLKLTRDAHFQAEVNTSISAVHVPTFIYDLDDAMLEALTCSSDLDARFRSNYAENPTLGLQYFGSSTGFLRHYPAMKWPKDNNSPGEPDLYDCRTRPWYTAAAASPKNVLILLDVSGSMTGLRSEIAEHVVLTTLETLTNNDYVNVFNFSEWTEPLVPCFNNTLVQANLENIREFKVALGQASTQNLANYTRAFEKAFSILERNYDGENSSRCNQAIVLITDGSPAYFQDIFDEWNKDKAIRLFTYLIGKEVTDWKEVLWMSCYNKGYFTKVETMGQVQEQVVKYLQVMSRPLVMNLARQVSYTPVYANNAEVVESEWQWDEKIRMEQKRRSERYKWFQNNVYKKGSNMSVAMEFADPIRDNPKSLSYSEEKIRNYIEFGRTNISEKMKRRVKAEQDRINLIRHLAKVKAAGAEASSLTLKQVDMNIKHAKVHYHRWGPFEKQFRFLISSSFPVLDLRSTAFDNKTKKDERIAHFLGVVGTDITIDELVKLTSPFKLGVNAYAFMITNNGYIVFHPDWRPTHDGILKPNYNTVDMFEVELVNKDNLYRNNDPQLLHLRKLMIDSSVNTTSMELEVRVHRDGFARVHVRRQEYVFGNLPRTPYTLVLAAPVGANRFIGEIELMRHTRDKNIHLGKYFDLVNSKTAKSKYIRRWGLNPDWMYCEFLGSKTGYIDNKEDSLLYFLQKFQDSSWANSSNPWRNTGRKGDDEELYNCDKSLVQSVVYDAEVTSIFKPDPSEWISQERRELKDAALMSFVATRSGLTRWVDFAPSRVSSIDIPFTKQYPRATEEIWYKRAVEWHEIDERAFVYTLPFDAGTRNSSPITATHAIFATKRGRKAPAAVVGLQFDHAKLFNILLRSSYPSGDARSFNACQSPHFDCFLLDDSGFIIYSELRDDNGRFMGDVDTVLMDYLIEIGIYKAVTITDFQGVCKQNVHHSSFANALFSPLQQIKMVLNWFLGRLAWLTLKFNLHSFINPDYGRTLAEYADSDRGGVAGEQDETMLYIAVATIPKTKLRPCDMQYKLYTFGPWYKSANNSFRNQGPLDICDELCSDYINVQKVPHSNLILVIVEAKCRCEYNWNSQPPRISIKGQEIVYDMYPGFINLTQDNPVLEELCLIRQPPLYRSYPSQCYHSHPDERLLRDDCGGAVSSLWASNLHWILMLHVIYYYI